MIISTKNRTIRILTILLFLNLSFSNLILGLSVGSSDLCSIESIEYETHDCCKVEVETAHQNNSCHSTNSKDQDTFDKCNCIHSHIDDEFKAVQITTKDFSISILIEELEESPSFNTSRLFDANLMNASPQKDEPIYLINSTFLN